MGLFDKLFGKKDIEKNNQISYQTSVPTDALMTSQLPALYLSENNQKKLKKQHLKSINTQVSFTVKTVDGLSKDVYKTELRIGLVLKTELLVKDVLPTH